MIIELDDERKNPTFVDELRQLKNKYSKEIARLKNNNIDVSELLNEMIGIKARTEKVNSRLNIVNNELKFMLVSHVLNYECGYVAG